MSSIDRNGIGEYLVYGANQPPIYFDRFHVDPFRFASEVSARANIESTNMAVPNHVTPQ